MREDDRLRANRAENVELMAHAVRVGTTIGVSGIPGAVQSRQNCSHALLRAFDIGNRLIHHRHPPRGHGACTVTRQTRLWNYGLVRALTVFHRGHARIVERRRCQNWPDKREKDMKITHIGDPYRLPYPARVVLADLRSVAIAVSRNRRRSREVDFKRGRGNFGYSSACAAAVTNWHALRSATIRQNDHLAYELPIGLDGRFRTEISGTSS